MAWTEPVDFTVGLTVTESIMDTYVSANLTWLYDNLPIRATMFHRDSIVTNGNAIANFIDASQAYNTVARQNAGADADSFTHAFVLAAGTYALNILGVTWSQAGIIDWDVDGSSIATGQDWYTVAAAYNALKTVASVVIATGGRHVLTGTVNGKNASSAGYHVSLTKMWLSPAAD